MVASPPSSSPSRLPRPSHLPHQPSSSSPSPSPSRSPASHSHSHSHTHSYSHPHHASSSTTSLYLRPRASTSRSHLPSPKVLPFPDLPVRPNMSREGSRTGSPAPPPPLSQPPATPSTVDSDSHSISSRPSSSSGPSTTSHPSAPAPPILTSTSPTRHPSPHPNRAVTFQGGEPLTVTRSAINLPSSSPSVSSPLSYSSTAANNPVASTSASSAPSTASARPRAATTAAAPSRTVATTRQQGFNPPSASTPTPTTTTTTASSSTTPSLSVLPASTLPTLPITLPTSILPSILRPSPVLPPTPTTPTTDTTPRPTPVKKLSNPPPLSVAITPVPPVTALNDHLYQSFLKGTCADVRLWVRAWDVGWLVHRVVLVQAGFFHSLFLGGFSETSSSQRRADPSGSWRHEDIELTFDDPNITRAAFEICLSRLYSSFPHLHFPVSLLPTPAHPLSPSFDTRHSPSLLTAHTALTNGFQLATPRILLSLLATTTYLGQQPLLREVLAMVLRTVGPGTVSRYLSFAIGDGIGDEEWVGQDGEGAKGLDSVGQAIDTDEAVHVVSHRASTDSTDRSDKSEDEIKVGGGGKPDHAPAETSNDTSLASTIESDDHGPPMPHFYGFVSNKIGEACVCWLARWGGEVLSSELGESGVEPEPDHSHYEGEDETAPVWAHGGIPASFARAVLSSDALFVANEMERYKMARKVVDLRRRAWNLEEEDVGDDEAELDKVFAEGIFYSHMTFEDLSIIAADIDPTTSLPYAPLAVLQAAHWSAADLKARVSSFLPEDDAPELGLTQTTSEIASVVVRRRGPRSRVPSPTSTWSKSTGVHSTSSHPTLHSFSSLSLSTSPPAPGGSNAIYHPVPTDDTHRIGAGGLLFLTTVSGNSGIQGMQGMPDLGPEMDDYPPDTPGVGVGVGKGAKPRPPPQGEKTFFGAAGGARTASEIEQTRTRELAFGPVGGVTGLGGLGGLGLDKDGKEERWSRLDPYRFSVEFWQVEKLAEKERLYSQTHFYAGSYFNVYVSTVRKKDKGIQLGIYLHRQSPNEPFPPPSSRPLSPISHRPSSPQPYPTVSGSVSGPSASAAGDTATLSPPSRNQLYRTFSTSPVSVGSPPAHPAILGSSPGAIGPSGVGGGGNGNGNGVAEPAYLDKRKVSKAYFSISCASALGTALIRFSSAPDSFSLSQSWGWKSSALRSEEYLSVPVPGPGQGMGVGVGGGEGLGEGEVVGWVGEVDESALTGGGSLRATVVVGVV